MWAAAHLVRTAEYVDIQDLYYTDAILRDLDDQDLDSDIAAGRDEDCDTSTPTNDRTPGSRVARKSGTRVDKLSGPTRRSRRAKKLIQLREKERASLLQVGRFVLLTDESRAVDSWSARTRTDSSKLMGWSTRL